VDPDVSVEIFLFGDYDPDARQRPFAELLEENAALRAEGSQARARNRALRATRDA
jgi:hypothetical protein